jgi:hypothetical protein
MVIDILLYKSYLSSGSSSPAVNALIFGALGAIFTVVSAVLHDRSKKLRKTGIKVEGIVFSIEHEVRSNDSMGLYYPVIRYVTLQDEWITKRYNVGSRPSSYSEGDTVTVIYDPNDTSVFMLNDSVSKIAPLAGIILGLIMIIAAVGMYILQ